MIKVSEIERLRRSRKGGKSPNLWLTLHIHLGSNPDETYRRILEVMDTVIPVCEAFEKKQRDWPADAEWKNVLPIWFVHSFDRAEAIVSILSDEELLKTKEFRAQEDMWIFGSWLDLVKDRVWTWWSSLREGDKLTIELELDSWPYSVGPLRYLVKVAGGKLAEVEE